MHAKFEWRKNGDEEICRFGFNFQLRVVRTLSIFRPTDKFNGSKGRITTNELGKEKKNKPTTNTSTEEDKKIWIREIR